MREEMNYVQVYFKKTISPICICLLAIIIIVGSSAQAQKPKEAEVKTESGSLITRIAPGDFLPIAVKLVNFGGGRRVDVTITYQILDDRDRVILSESETVAVETTASYVKLLQIPHDTSPGKYTVYSTIVYQDQKVPATSNYQFEVEKKIVGLFVSDFILYGSITLAIGVVFAVVSRLIIRKRRQTRFTPHEYSNIPDKDRMFYELISDIIMNMRSRVGDEALKIATQIEGLEVNEDTGKVLKIDKSPAKIIALLVLQYEKHLGEKVSFALRKPGKEKKDHLATVNKNLVIVRKYFE